MAIDFAKKFGAASLAAAAAATSTQQQKPKAQFWLNIGYLTDVKDDNGDFRFVSLASGIPMDTMEKLPTNSKNQVFAHFQAARNDLAEQLVAEAAANLEPGQSVVSEPIPSFYGLQIQVRRVSEETEVSTDPSQNLFARKLVTAPAAPVQQSA